MMHALRNTLDTYRATRLTHTSRYVAEMADIPPTLYPFWKQTAHHEFKGIPRDALFFARAAEGLVTFFDCVRHAKQRCALPSKAADSVWHAWAQLSQASLDAFCIKHFGQLIPHVEGADMTGQMEDALAVCLVQARRLELKSAASPTLPRLFALDRKVGMPGGFAYLMVSGVHAFRHMDEAGKPVGELFFPHSLAPVSLLQAGHISQYQYDDYVARKRPDQGSNCWAGVMSDFGSGAGDAGCGSGCGS
ncbi:MAG: hypothetical protein V4633_22800 [Pseudomonadota bacterium]